MLTKEQRERIHRHAQIARDNPSSERSAFEIQQAAAVLRLLDELDQKDDELLALAVERDLAQCPDAKAWLVKERDAARAELASFRKKTSYQEFCKVERERDEARGALKTAEAERDEARAECWKVVGLLAALKTAEERIAEVEKERDEALAELAKAQAARNATLRERTNPQDIPDVSRLDKLEAVADVARWFADERYCTGHPGCMRCDLVAEFKALDAKRERT